MGCMFLQALQFEGGTHIASSGALLTLSGMYSPSIMSHPLPAAGCEAKSS